MLKKPWNQYPIAVTSAAKLLCDRERRRASSIMGYDDIELNPDWVHPDLVSQLEGINDLLTNHWELTNTETIAVVIQQWEASRVLLPAYHPDNAL